ncbi:hypothetical protein [Nostoc sp. ATCC 53789]|uniref:hypothetical protein n=1 Tax=Nostoc sp. ATCC 53789 TaxID=76335 RepID=UPI000DEC83C2|nr:hypothetical protein [Nostoc sp. ATCC 53789]QHG21299.1 hypothetical protein GJB62_36280 [Nostoc sp. ATCC 53789]RCJ16199.1 hypothetical protein A6V25_31605 [Nostoc sp. ATCC 53789]
MKLFTIGDSISQGFMSLAAARTDLCFSTLIAKSMGLKVGAEYLYPEWLAGGLPANIEKILRRLEKKYGSDINALDWLTILPTIEGVLDEAEDYYERQGGSAEQRYPGGIEFFDNVAIQGFDIADSWMITPKVCKYQIKLSNDKGEGKDDFFGLPNAVFYRTALKVLNPSLNPSFDNHSQLGWLNHHTIAPGGVENLIIWLGANNALGTVIGLEINQTPNDPDQILKNPSQKPESFREVREKWNLWHPNDFKAEYQELLDRVDAIMQNNTNPDWNVFIGTVPFVTIAPLAKGVGPTTEIHVPGEEKPLNYYKYYTYFPFEEDTVRETGTLYLTLQDAIYIDDCIRTYNKVIKELVDSKNSQQDQPRYHIVDLANALQEIAFKRNAGQVQYEFPEYFNFVYPQVNTKYYHADTNGLLRQGGLFSLDGIHPSAIGQGLIAYEFLKEMKKVGVVDSTELDWKSIFSSDQLYSQPITLMHEFYDNKEFAETIIKLFGRNPLARNPAITRRLG